jgi:exopolyphosphatase / guanosine-5'-triphosphate,3'-diphosphate pyrophosphatase
VGAVGDVLTAAGWPAGSVSRDGLDWMRQTLLEAHSADRLRLVGMKDDRRPIIGGGLSILRAVFDLLEIDQLKLASGGLRHGLICDLMGSQLDQTNLPAASVMRMATRFAVDSGQAARVARVATHFFKQILPALSLESEDNLQRHLRKLDWAAQLHEIGVQISHSDYHKHGAYILENADVVGLALSQLHRLSLLVLGHRGKLRKLDVNFDDNTFILQLMCLRLAVILCHARRDPDTEGLSVSADSTKPQEVTLTCRRGWAQAFPQSAHLLNEEVIAWQKTRWSLNLTGL